MNAIEVNHLRRIYRAQIGVFNRSNILPLTCGIAASRALAAGASLNQVSSLLVSELGIGLMYGLLGYFLFAWFEVQAKRNGTLETV